MRGGNIAPIGTTLLICLPPALLLFTLFVVLPVGEAAWYSFFRWDGFGTPTEWVGLRNYESLFANRVFHVALRNNLLIIVVSLGIQLPLALAMALIICCLFPPSRAVHTAAVATRTKRTWSSPTRLKLFSRARIPCISWALIMAWRTSPMVCDLRPALQR